MTNAELNEYIKHYLLEDKTKSAIMLNAPWGSGKSHYILNDLKDYLAEEENGSYKCVIVSLYGISSPQEISKNIYLELKTNVKPLQTVNRLSKKIFKKRHKEIKAYGKIVGVTLFKGLFNQGGMDLNAPESTLQQLYNSVDLSGKLIILEDIERSKLSILDLLGYVNSLVEQDGVKVMLVANEEEIIKRIPDDFKNLEEEKKAQIYRNVGLDNRPFTDETKIYLKTKEKTISDTVVFEGDYKQAIRNIISSYENDTLNRFLSDEFVNELANIITGKNLRSFIFACQKAVDMYKKMSSEMEEDFVRALFFGIVYFSIKEKSGETDIKWDGDSNLSLTLGGGKYPLFSSCYEYLHDQKIDTDKIAKNAVAYKELKLYDRDFSRTNDKDLIIIQNFHCYYSKDILQSLERIEERLLDPNDISFYAYDGMIKAFISLSKVIDYDFETCKKRMIKNLKGLSTKLNGFYLFPGFIDRDNENDKSQYENFRANALKSLSETDTVFLNFDYTPESAKDFYNQTIKSEPGFDGDNPFALRLDMDKLSKMLVDCSPEQIEYIRGAFLSVYRVSNIGQFLACDKSSIDTLLDKIKAIYESEEIDPIQKLQIKWFISNLENISNKL